MNVALREPWTDEQFLAWEERQELRFEFDGVGPVAMTGGTLVHDAIQIGLVSALHGRLRGTRCRVHGNSLKVLVMDSIRYPDAFVTCGPVRSDSTVLREPVVIFEVISKSTARTDRMVKNREYAGTRSVRRYVILEQEAVEATMFERTESGDWVGHILAPDAVLHMPEIGVTLPLADIYEGIDLAGAEPGEGEAVPAPG